MSTPWKVLTPISADSLRSKAYLSVPRWCSSWLNFVFPWAADSDTCRTPLQWHRRQQEDPTPRLPLPRPAASLGTLTSTNLNAAGAYLQASHHPQCMNKELTLSVTIETKGNIVPGVQSGSTILTLFFPEIFFSAELCKSYLPLPSAPQGCELSFARPIAVVPSAPSPGNACSPSVLSTSG